MAPANLTIPMVKGAKTADTIGVFFGKAAIHFQEAAWSQGAARCTLFSVDMDAVWSLRWTLPKFAFQRGRIVDFHAVSARDNAVLTTFRIAVNEACAAEMQQHFA